MAFKIFVRARLSLKADTRSPAIAEVEMLSQRIEAIDLNRRYVVFT